MAEDIAASNNITCPRCGVVYPVDARAFTGTEVRCKRCNHVFTAGAHAGQSGDPFNITRSFPVFPELKADPAATPPPVTSAPVLLPEPTPPPRPQPITERRLWGTTTTAGQKHKDWISVAIVIGVVIAVLIALYVALA